MFTGVLIFLILLCMVAGQSMAQDTAKAFQPRGKISGYMFGDYFYNMQNGDSAKKDLNGVQFRRIYLYYNYEWSPQFAAQFLLEADQVQLTSGGKIGVFVKTAYLQWNDVLPMASLYFGLSPTPTWSTHSEKVWGYRSIEKTIVDLRNAGSASDLGIALKGKFDKGGIVNYHIMVGNGTGQKPEFDKFKKVYGYVVVKPVKGASLEAYTDYEGGADDKNKITFKGSASYEHEKFTVGVEGFQQTREKASVNKADVVLFGLSVFAHATLVQDQLRAYARFDFFNPDTKVDNAGFKENYIIAGLDYLPAKDIHVMPNVLINSYSAKGAGSKDSDVTARVTFFYIY
jgi:hypothetical protein